MNKIEFLKNRPFRPEDAKNMQDWIEQDIKNVVKSVYNPGVIYGLKVSHSDSGMNIKIAPGFAYDEDYNFIKVDSYENLTLENSDSNYDRYDIVVIKSITNIQDNIDTENIYGRGNDWIVSKNIINGYEINIIKGNAKANPTIPEVPEKSILLATIFVPKNSNTLLEENIVDNREISKNNNKPIISETEPTEDLFDGLIWYNPITSETKIYLNKEFKYIGGIPPYIGEEQPLSLKEGLVWFNPSTFEIKMYLNGEFRNIGSGGLKFERYYDYIMLEEETNEIVINIEQYNPYKDILNVKQNTTILQENKHYVIDKANKKIIKTEGNWSKNTNIGIEVITVLNIPSGEDKLTIIKYETNYIVSTPTNI